MPIRKIGNLNRTAISGLVLAFAMQSLAEAPRHTGSSRDEAPPREVIFIFNWRDRHWTVGQAVPLQYVSAILFLAEPCPLRFIGSKRMHRAWHFHDVGCWEPTTNDGYNFASSITGDIRNTAGPMEYFVRGNVQADSSVLITEPGFDSLTFEQIAAARIEERLSKERKQTLDGARP